jgi:hypothetical protein
MITNILLAVNLIFFIATLIVAMAALFLCFRCVAAVDSLRKLQEAIDRELDLIAERFDLSSQRQDLHSKAQDEQHKFLMRLSKSVIRIAKKQNGDDDADYWKNN